MVEKTFIVVRAESSFDGILLNLKPIEPTPDSVHAMPVPRTEEAKIATEVAQTMVQTLATLSPPPQSFMPESPFIVKLWLTTEQYENLGKPTVNDRVKMQLEIEKEET